MKLSIKLPDAAIAKLFDERLGAGAYETAVKLSGGGNVISPKAAVYNGLRDAIAPELAAKGIQGAQLVIEADDPGDPVPVVGPVPAGIGGFFIGLLTGRYIFPKE